MPAPDSRLRERGGDNDVLPVPSDLIQELDLLANLNSTVLVTGEVGTGKSTLAKYIHSRSRRSDRPFVRVDCAALVSTLAQAELFGYKRGAFTDARESKPGLVEQAGAGTLFLDEIGVLDGDNQARLLTLLEERTLRPIGGTRDVAVKARIICATNENLPALVRMGKFRRDLYDRCAALQLTIPPLRERIAFLPQIIARLLRDICEYDLEEPGCKLPEVSSAAYAQLCSYEWPGNLRQLRNVLLSAVAHGGRQRIELHHLRGVMPDARGSELSHQNDDTKPSVAKGARYRAPEDREQEREMLIRALRETQVKARAAHVLGMARTTLYEKIHHYRIEAFEWRHSASTD